MKQTYLWTRGTKMVGQSSDNYSPNTDWLKILSRAVWRTVWVCGQESQLSQRKTRYSLQGGPKMVLFIVRLITSPNANLFSKFFHCQNQKTICNKTLTTDPTTTQVCRYSTLWNVTWRTRAGDATDRLRDQRWSSLACGPKQPRLKSSWLCCSGCSSTDDLSMLTILDSQPAKESHCRWVGQSAAAFGSSRHWSVASPALMRRPAARQTRWKFDVKTVKMWFLDNNWDNKRVVSVVNFF